MERILIVEDEASIRKALEMGLASENFEVDVASDGRSGILKGRQKEHDILIADLCLPDITGLEVIKAIKQISPEIIPIVITGNGCMESSLEAIRLEVSDYMEKPLSMKSVKTSIEQGLKKRSLRRKKMQKELQFMLDMYKRELSANINIEAKTQCAHLDNWPETIPMLVHQINNPLMSISGSAELAMFQLDDAEAVKQCFIGIIEAVQKIREINCAILKSNKPEKEENEALDLRVTLNICLRMFKDLITLRGISLEKDIGESESSGLSVLGNRFGLEQVFKNLILNAIDSMNSAPKKLLKIRTETNEKNSMISVYIEDTGCGIPEETLDKIFTSCFTSKKYGAGLGLPVAKSILEKHRGKIEIKSKVGTGSTFKVSLPAV